MSDERARLANGILTNPLFEESLQTLRTAYVDALVALKPDDNEGRWRYATAIRGLAFIKAHLEAVVQNAQITEEQIRQLREVEKRESTFKRAIRGLWSDNVSSEKPLPTA